MDLGLAGKTAIVTGGASNIGRSIVLAFAVERANIAIADLDEKQAHRTAGDANDLGGHALVIKADVGSRDSVEIMVERTLDTFGRIDVLVNNVAWANHGPFLVDKPDTEIEKEIRLDYWSAIYCCRAVSRRMIAQQYGKIVNIGSDAGRSGVPGGAVFSGTKAALVGLTKALAKEMGRHGINVNCVCPGWVVPEKPGDTGEGSFWYGRFRDVFTAEYLEKQTRGNAIRRPGNARDIANMVVFLASDCASYVTGQTISVDGGAVMV
ncbi:MAG: hypothetical protein A2Y91_02980 [Chloroflexi bacterium RBG_13_54_8]|nr:MAG: hypothetical protein A2Y91_02980 [Chloroflexi bacterium RBG_13_54_8]